MKKNIESVMQNIINNDNTRNRQLFIKTYGNLNYVDEYGNTLYHLIVASETNRGSIKYAITMLIDNGINPNAKNQYGDTFMHIAFRYVKSFDDLLFILKYACENGSFDVNAKNNCYYTLLHNAILCRAHDGELLRLITVLKDNGFEYTKIIDDYIETSSLSMVMKNNIRRSFDDINSIQRNSSNVFVNHNPNPRSTSSHSLLNNKYGTILNDKHYPSNPAIGRNEEIADVIVSLATKNKLPVLVGPSGVGKTTIVDGLTYNIINNNVPDFLKKRQICEVNVSTIISGTKYRGDMESKMHDLCKMATRNNTILFIDEFHMVFGAGSSEYDRTDISDILKYYIDRYNLKVIGATTDEEYDLYMANHPLKRRFEVISVKELDNTKLYDIALNTLSTYDIPYSEEFKNRIDNIIYILLDLTAYKNRVYDDRISNPDLLLSIIDRAVAYAIVSDEHILQINHLIKSIQKSERLYNYAKDVAINKLNGLINNYDFDYDDNKVITLETYRKQHIMR